jgi:alpha,alpha-trehalase
MFNIIRRYQLAGYFFFILIAACTTQNEKPAIVSEAENEFYRPEVELGILFHDVQMEGIFPDSKTFVDYRPLFTPDEILGKYEMEKSDAAFNIKDFVDRNFSPPTSITSKVAKTLNTDSTDMGEHITGHWDYLTRQPSDEPGISTIIDLPFPYVVPGGRFREIYYWDSFFTMQGLAASDRWDLIESMLNNFAFLIDQVGFIPNGNRTYFLGRSQPPFFSTMVMLYADEMGIEKALKYLPQLESEYNFWMDGADQLTTKNHAFRRVVMPDSGVVLNRYWDDQTAPRPESYKEDFEMGERFDNDDRRRLFRDIRAACESGWDFSSRWFEDGNSFESITTTGILPVDLNSLLLHLESTLGLMYEDMGNYE